MGAQTKRRVVAFILPNFNAGGAERVMITVANHLNRQKFRPMLIAFDDRGPLRSLVAPDIDVHAFHTSWLGGGFFQYVRVIRALRPDVVISTMAHINLVVLLAKLFVPSVPVIVREAVTPSYFADRKFKNFILFAGYALLYPFAHKIISPTMLVFEGMPSFLRKKKDKLVRIFNPVDLDMVNTAYDGELRALYCRPDQKLFVASGRLVDQKGFDLLIRALSVWGDREDWRLLILGDGPDRQKLQGMIESYRLEQITLIGFQDNPWQFYAIADAFLLPSRHEGLPNVALEALSVGTPVIAAATAGGIAEIAEQANKDVVFIAEGMESFVGKMQQIQFRSKDPAPLLPEAFSIGSVISAYENVLS